MPSETSLGAELVAVCEALVAAPGPRGLARAFSHLEAAILLAQSVPPESLAAEIKGVRNVKALLDGIGNHLAATGTTSERADVSPLFDLRA